MSTEASPMAPTAPSAWAGVWHACWADRRRAALTLLLFAALMPLVVWALQWGLWQAVWVPDAEACQAARGVGACWGVVVEKHRLILFGRYPYEAHWRPLVASLLLLALLVYSANPQVWRRSLLAVWAVGLFGVFALLGGRVGPWSLQAMGLTPVAAELWGGLPLTLLLTVLSLSLAFPLAVGLALGRRSPWPVVRGVCVAWIELLRGVPLVSVLFMASFMLPLLLPAGAAPDVLLRVMVALVMFVAAYLAEVVRGGLQGVPQGQHDAARALGMGPWQAHRDVLLPQALRHSLPSLVNHAIGLFKDTSLVTIVSLYELSGAMGLALGGDAQWRRFKLEAYLFIAAIYFIGCWALSRYSDWLAAQLHAART